MSPGAPSPGAQSPGALSRGASAAAVVAALALWVAPALAQEAEDDGLVGLVDGDESPELRALRLAEQELFGGQPLTEAPDAAGAVRVSDGPAAVTTDTPRRAPEPPQASRDLSWLRGLTLPDIPVRWDERVIRYLEYFRNDPRGQSFIRAWLRRVDRYGPMIRRVLREQGLPRDLIFVAMVESGFDPTARSHAGAAGMWQFVPRTGEELGLTIDHWADLRLDPERSTVAAGRYLSMLHDRFGTWELAFAAYNMGYGAMLRSIRKYNSNDYWELAHLEAGLPFETNLYVAKIVACAIVAHNRERFGLGELELEEPIRWETVEVPGGVSLGVVARAAGADAQTVRQLNPALRRGRTPPGRDSFAVRIPQGSGERFARQWARVRPSHPVHRPQVLRFGETLADLARAHGTTEDAIRELNGVEEGERVGAGTTLLVPEGRRRGRAEPSEPPVIAVPDGPRAIEGRARVFYRVTRGDELAEVARFFRVRPDEIRQWNAIDPNASLQSGMFLQLFVPREVDLTRAVVITPDEARVLVIGSEEFFAYHEDQNGRTRFRYRVRPGDTLGHIAQRFGLRVASIARINQIAQSSTIHPGDELVLYVEPDRVPREYRPDALDGDALEPGGEATAERTGPELGPREDGSEEPAPVPPDDPSEQIPAP